MSRAIVVPPGLEAPLDRLIDRMTARNGGTARAACQRAVEITVLKRGIEELEKDLREFDAAPGPTVTPREAAQDVAGQSEFEGSRGGKVA